ncbi:efflux RND transporter periplasmic adaptor subunit [Pseudoroseomonas cervicalis]|uniref:Efflux transporter, RND family, MFP subunit n=1 Tax=Pseudoroseomonas cervicalis ATCC 49957 TaxID=525371 RepID=D5RLL1_9PROT|nr:HlyD family secretion protein [Pseudoroseomonas cervicalis]EFH11810.1 efflux transporter, RND family, MFP subunit [Pseudoroseomonas cervicalis ATCC 49957]
MKPLFARFIRIAVTLLLVAAALFAARELWRYYMEAPWTRDGRVRADIIGVAPDVSGFVAEVLVQDNAVVAQGQPLFRLDQARFALALQQAEAVVESRTASLERARRDERRYDRLDAGIVSQQRQEQAHSDAATAAASLQEAEAARELARLNLARTEIRAPAAGTITNLTLRPGAYVSAGSAVMALVDAGSLHVQGYFEETKLARIHPGDPVRVTLMGDGRVLSGHVESIAGGIEDRERSAGLVANVNPTFSWVRLAQRVPVRVKLDAVPEGLRLIPGRTATVSVIED